eukprot:9475228-Pyramimonas_sp.AAC.2
MRRETVTERNARETATLHTTARKMECCVRACVSECVNRCVARCAGSLAEPLSSAQCYNNGRVFRG